MSFTVIVIDDDSLFRRAIETTLRGLQDDLVLFDFAAIPDQSECLVEPHLVLLDYHIPGSTFDDNIAQARDRFKSSKIVIVSADESPENIIQAIDLGAAGFIPKSSNPQLLIAALRLVLVGQTYLPSQVLSFRPVANQQASQAYHALSDAQRRVLDEVLNGKSNKVIAIELGLAIGTVKSHLSTAYKALGVNNRTDAVLLLTDVARKHSDEGVA